MQAPKYSPLQGSLSTRADSRALVAVLLTPWHRPRCPKCHQPYTPCHYQPKIPTAYYLLAPSLWYSIPVAIHERRCNSSISWVIWACKFVCLPGLILENDRETWLPTCDFTSFWSICYSTKSSHLMHSFRAWPPCCDSIFEAFVHGIGSVGKWSSSLGARKIILPHFLLLSGDQDFLHKKPQDDIRSWAQKAWSRC